MQSDSKAGRLVGVRAPRFSAEIDAELFNRAEKELAAFVAAANTLHGEEQARAAADDWLLELIALKEPCKGASLDLRSVTIGAARRLAQRLSIPSPAAIQISLRQKTSPEQRGKQRSPAQENVIHATTSGRISHAVLAIMAGILLLAAPANALAVHSNSRHLTQDKPVNVVVIRWSSVSRKHEFQQDSDHPSKNSHNSLLRVQFTHSEERPPILSVGTNSRQESNSMEAIGLLVTLEAGRGKEADAEAFLKSAQPLALDEKGTLKWYAIKLGPGKFGIFDTFANEGGRDAHLSGEIAKALGARANELLAIPPQIEKLEVLASTPLKG